MKKLVVLFLFVALFSVAVWFVACRGQRAAAPTPTAAGVASALPPLGPACGGHCGTERWLVKTLSDPDRDCVSLKPVDATIEELTALPQPARRPSRGRVRPVECTVYRVTAHLAGWDSLMRGEKDHDVHLVIFGLGDQRAHMIAEIPDPSCSGACQSGLGGQFAATRAALLREVQDPGSPIGRNPDSALVVVTGVGFFDFLHHQTGVAPNGIELHPVLSIEYLPLVSRATP